MSRIEEKFNELKKENKKALITFITAGDPSLGTTLEIIREMAKKGADIVEIGIPYSDPIAEGPVIQSANARALKNPIKIKDIMTAIEKERHTIPVPLVYLLYFNCILQYGPGDFFAQCAKAGIDGVIIPDLPFEERDEIESFAEIFNVDIISLISPTSQERVEKIAKKAKGFLYCVSSLGVTGMRSSFKTDFKAFFSTINRSSTLPKALGFGISTPEHIKQLKGYCDGLIIGSAVVKKVEESVNSADAVEKVGDFVHSLRVAMDS